MGRRLLARTDARTTAQAVLVYVFLGAVGVAAALGSGHDPLRTDPWLPVSPETGLWASLAMGACLAGAMVVMTRILLVRFAWARELHRELRPAVQHLGTAGIALMALCSGAAEEVVFRGALLQGIGGVPGLLLSTLVFGVIHQVRGRARWPWAIWATIMGGLLGLVFTLTGSLFGPILAHVTVNAINLRLLRHRDV